MSVAAGPVPDPVAGVRPPAGLVFGIDVVAVARAQQLLERYGPAIRQRVATPEEAAWIGTAPARLGAVLGLKEASIKAMGGRPEPFTWQQISTGTSELSVTFSAPPAASPGGWPAPVIEVLRGFASGLQLPELTAAACQVHGPGLTRVLDQLPAPGRVRGAGCFGVRDDHVFAAVCFWRDDSDE